MSGPSILHLRNDGLHDVLSEKFTIGNCLRPVFAQYSFNVLGVDGWQLGEANFFSSSNTELHSVVELHSSGADLLWSSCRTEMTFRH